MNAEIGVLYAAGVAYLGLLFFIAHASERGWLPDRWVRHPMVYVLSLGVYATTWTYYGSVGFAADQGYHFLTIYLGVTLAFVLTPVLLMPTLRLVREQQMTSLADLFAWRYRSPWTGLIVTLFMLVGVLPYIALQIRAVTESVAVLTDQATPHFLALGFCVTLALFAVLFGARHITPREKHEGLVVAIAFESLVKLLALLLVGAVALFGVFSGPAGLSQWLSDHPEALQALYAPVTQSSWYSLMLLAFAAAFLLPRQFHMLFVENMDPKALQTASWAFPLFLLLLNLPIPLILWGGQASGLTMATDYFSLGLAAQHSSGLALLTFIGGVSAASAMMIVTTLALASMCLNHLILPARIRNQTLAQGNLYRWLLWGRRLLIFSVIALGYGFYWLLEFREGLVQLGLISFVAVAQFLPGYLAMLFWPRATRAGFISGLLGGIGIWVITLIMPLLQESGLAIPAIDLPLLLGWAGTDRWTFATFWTLFVNISLFVTVSLLTRPDSETLARRRGGTDDTLYALQSFSDIRDLDDLQRRLAEVLGPETAAQELKQALSDLNMRADALKPGDAQKLRGRLQRNLTGLLGPMLANIIIESQLKLTPQTRVALAHSLRFIEERLEHSDVRLRGLAAELDTLRRYHRQVLHELPLGVVSLSPEEDILIWNYAMGTISGISGRDMVGQSLKSLKGPWVGVLRAFLRSEDRHLYKTQMNIAGRQRWFNLHKSAVDTPAAGIHNANELRGTVILIEDLTELHDLENEVTHRDRLASIGRLAAGVAHEIGNPLTGIASLAQNLKDEHRPEEIDKSITQILQQTRRINNIVQSLITFSHAGEAPPAMATAVNVHECVAEAIQLLQLGQSSKGVQCQNRSDPKLHVLCDAQQLLQVFINLINNALQASKPGDRVLISAAVMGDKIEMRIEDEGPGIAEELLDRIFDPFFTTKAAGSGTGLGLSVVYSILQDHGGTIHAENRPQGGACFIVRLPAAQELIPA